MIAATCLLAVMLQGQQYQPIFPKLFPQPTGQNGMEEYIRAVDLVLGQDMAAKYFEAGSTPERTLELKLQCAENTDAVSRLIAQGNRKPAAYANGLSLEAIDDRAIDFAVTAKVLWRRAEGLMALGRTDEAFAGLEDLLVFGRAIGGEGGLLSLLRGRRVAEFGLRGIHDYRQQIPLPVATQLVQLANDIMQPDLLRQALIRNDEKFDKLVQGDMARDGIVEFAKEVLGEERVYDDVKSLSREFSKWLSFYRTETLQLISNDESTWSKAADELFAGNEEQLPSGQALAYWVMDLTPDVLRLELRQRAQFRMVRLYGRIAEYRWVHSSYPAQLDQIGSEQERTDPLTGKEFHYSNQGETFDLYSSGIPEIGEVRVRYSRSGL